jgi:hypothetical protein
MTFEIKHTQLNELIKEHYKTKLALFCWGTFGIGKSFQIKQAGIDLAEDKKREFKDWNKLTNDEKKELFDNPDKYFVFIDVRLSEFDPSDIKGLPSLDGNDTIDWKIPKWAKFITLEDSDGILFFDEINLAPPLVQSSVYKIIYDRIIVENKINNNVLIVGAGNLNSDKAHTHEIPAPLRDRGSEVELKVPTVDDWIMNFAIDNSIDSRIIAFLKYKESYLHKVDFADKQKFVTPRGWERVSTLIKNMTNIGLMELLVCSAIGEGVAREFIAFLKVQDKINLDEIIKDPSKLKNVKEVSIKYLLTTTLAEKYSLNKINLKKINDVIMVLDEINNPEFVALTLQLCSQYTKDRKNPNKTSRFLNEFSRSKDLSAELINKYVKYILS